MADYIVQSLQMYDSPSTAFAGTLLYFSRAKSDQPFFLDEMVRLVGSVRGMQLRVLCLLVVFVPYTSCRLRRFESGTGTYKS